MARFYEVTVGAAQAFNGRCSLEHARAVAEAAAQVHRQPAVINRTWHPAVSRVRIAVERVYPDGHREAITLKPRSEGDSRLAWEKAGGER